MLQTAGEGISSASGPEGAVEGIVGAPVAGEHVAVDLLVGRVDPALDRAGVHVRRQAERAVAGLAAADAIGIRALAVGREVDAALARVRPERVQEGPRLGQRGMLARLDLRLRPVDAEDLRPARVERAEVRVERRIGRPLVVAVASQVLADRVVPRRGLLAREDAAHDRRHRAAGRLTDRRLLHPVPATRSRSRSTAPARVCRARASWISSTSRRMSSSTSAKVSCRSGICARRLRFVVRIVARSSSRVELTRRFWTKSRARAPRRAAPRPSQSMIEFDSSRGSLEPAELGLVFRGGQIELERMDSADPPLAVHRLYGDRHRQLRRPGTGGDASALGDLLAAAPARLAPVHRSVLVRAAVCHQVAQRRRDASS